MSLLRVAGGQFSPAADMDQNLGTISELARRAAGSGTDLLVLPEYASFFQADSAETIRRHAEPLDGKFVSALMELARRDHLFIVAGMGEAVVGETRFHNTLVCVDPEAGVVGVYRKVHLFDAFGHRGSDHERPGNPAQAVVIDVRGVQVGLQTCYDLRFPESSRRLVDAGAQLIVVPAQWVPGPSKERHWSILLAARAIENTAYVLGVGQSTPHGTGCSMLLDPEGTVRAALGPESDLLVGHVDLAQVERVRRANPALDLRCLHVEPGAPDTGR
jgi:Predicted amidohydrolase